MECVGARWCSARRLPGRGLIGVDRHSPSAASSIGKAGSWPGTPLRTQHGGRWSCNCDRCTRPRRVGRGALRGHADLLLACRGNIGARHNVADTLSTLAGVIACAELPSSHDWPSSAGVATQAPATLVVDAGGVIHSTAEPSSRMHRLVES